MDDGEVSKFTDPDALIDHSKKAQNKKVQKSIIMKRCATDKHKKIEPVR